MAADGSIIIDTRIDTSGFTQGEVDAKKALDGIAKKTKQLGDTMGSAFSGKVIDSSSVKDQSEKVKAILADTEKSAKSKAASIAAIYKKQGLSQSEAFEKAWEQIEKTSSSGSKKVKKDVKSIGAAGKDAGETLQAGLVGGISGAVKKIGSIIGGLYLGRALINFGKESIELGSDLAEVQNVVDSVFGDMSSKVDEFAQKAITSAGLSETMAKQFVGTFGAMATSFGFATDEAYDMSTSLTQLAGDVASFYNLSQDEAYTKLKSVFTGETESLKELGVVMTQSALDSYALANGFGKTTSAMTEQEKVALRYQFVMNQLSTASGDFLRTSDGWANQVRVLKLQIDSLKATIGQGLINIFTPVIKVINIVLAKLATVANAFKAFTELLTGNKASEQTSSASAGLSADDYDDAASSAENLADATQDVADATNEAKKANKGYLSGLDQIKKFSENQTTTAGTTGGTSGSTSGISAAVQSVDYGNISDGETVIDNMEKKLSSFLQKIKEYVKTLQAELSRFSSIAKNAFTWILDEVLTPLASWTWNEVVPRFFNTLANAMKILNEILIALQPLWQWFWDTALKPLAEWTGGIFLEIWDGINAALNAFAQWCKDNPEIIQIAAIAIASFAAAWALVNIATKIKGIVDAIGSFIGMITAMKTAMGAGQTAMALLGKAFSGLASPAGIAVAVIGAIITVGVLLWKNWDQIKEKAIEIWGSIKDWLGRTLEKISKNISDFAESAKKFINKGFSFIKDNILTPFCTFLNGIFKKDWEESFGAIGTVVNGFFDIIEEVMDSVTGVFTGFITFITSVFAGDFETAFGTIFGGLTDIVKKPINAVIGLLNRLINAVNNMLSAIESSLKFDFTIPNPLGGTLVDYHWSAKLPRITKSIPLLAKGAVIPPNAPFMAMLGDQKRGTNIEAPLSTIEEALRNVLKSEGITGNGNDTGGSFRFTAQINGRTLFDEVISEAKMRQMRTGKNPFELA